MTSRNRFLDDISYKDLPRHTTTGQLVRPTTAISRYASIPAGIQLFSEWNVQFNPFRQLGDFDQTNDWVVSTTGAGSAAALSDDTPFPALTLTTDVNDNDRVECQFTGNNGTGATVNFLSTVVGTTPGHTAYFETMIRIREAGVNDDGTVEQCDWFAGLGFTDTTFLAANSDYIGFRKRDVTDQTGNPIIFCFAGNGAGSEPGGSHNVGSNNRYVTGWTQNAPSSFASTAARRANRVVGPNEWVKLAFLAVGNDSTVNSFYAHVWINNVCVGTFGPSGAGPWGRNDGLGINNVVATSAVIPDLAMCTTLALRNGEASTRSMDVAYVLLAQKYGDI